MTLQFGPFKGQPVPDSSVGQGWAVIRVHTPDGMDVPRGDLQQVAELETAGPVRLTRMSARHLAALLLAYAGED